jgi:hypothetical protein
MHFKTFLSLISAISLAASLAGVAPARAEGDDRDHGYGDSDHDGGHHGRKSPQVVVISLDGAKPDLIQKFIEEGVLPHDGGLARLRRHGAVAVQNVTASPSLTAVSHIAIATGSTAVHNDIPSNTFEAIVAPISSSLSGFAAPIGGYRENPLGPSPRPTASPLWVLLRQQGKKVITATWPGGDGADISINNTVVQIDPLCSANALAQLEGGDAEDPLQPQRWDRAGVHARRLEHRRKPEILRQCDRVAVDAGNVEEDLAASRVCQQGRQNRLGTGAAVGHQRADLAPLPAWADHAPADKRAIAHQRTADMAGSADPGAQERGARCWKHRRVRRLDRRQRDIGQRDDTGLRRGRDRDGAAVADVGISEREP